MELARDTRLALRRLRQTPGFTTMAVLTLALGTGANTAVFSVLDPLLLRTLPVGNPQELVVLRAAGTLESTDRWWPGAVDRFALAGSVFAGVLWTAGPSELTVSYAGRDMPASADTVSANYFAVLGLAPQRGRLFVADGATGRANAAAGGAGVPVAVLDYDYWTHAFGADPDIVGRAVAIRGVATTVIGIAPRSFHGIRVGSRPDVYLAVGARENSA